MKRAGEAPLVAGGTGRKGAKGSGGSRRVRSVCAMGDIGECSGRRGDVLRRNKRNGDCGRDREGYDKIRFVSACIAFAERLQA